MLQGKSQSILCAVANVSRQVEMIMFSPYGIYGLLRRVFQWRVRGFHSSILYTKAIVSSGCFFLLYLGDVFAQGAPKDYSEESYEIFFENYHNEPLSLLEKYEGDISIIEKTNSKTMTSYVLNKIVNREGFFVPKDRVNSARSLIYKYNNFCPNARDSLDINNIGNSEFWSYQFLSIFISEFEVSSKKYFHISYNHIEKHSDLDVIMARPYYRYDYSIGNFFTKSTCERIYQSTIIFNGDGSTIDKSKLKFNEIFVTNSLIFNVALFSYLEYNYVIHVVPLNQKYETVPLIFKRKPPQ
jgi:hypothetical protein